MHCQVDRAYQMGQLFFAVNLAVHVEQGPASCFEK